MYNQISQFIGRKKSLILGEYEIKYKIFLLGDPTANVILEIIHLI